MKPADLLRRIPGVTTDLSRALDGKARWFLWQGKIGSRPGRYWIPNLFDASKLPAAVKALAQTEGISEFSAAGLVEKSHKGIGNKEIGLCPWAFAEMDAVARDEQDRRLAALSAATGLEWAMTVFSGGKSVHAYLAFLTALAPDDPLRLEIQKLLIVILEGDSKITDLNRLMRLPSYSGKDRPQPVLSISASRYDATDIRDRLVAYAATLGLTDVDTAYRAVQVAEDLEHEAARDHADADAMRAAARVLRDSRATVTAADIAAATRAWKRTGGSGVAGAGGTIGSGSVAWLPEAEWIALTAGLTAGERCSPPCCVGYVRGTTGKFYGDSVRCHRCQKSYRPERALVSRDLPPEVEMWEPTRVAPPAKRVVVPPVVEDPVAAAPFADAYHSPEAITARVERLVIKRRYADALALAERVTAPSEALYGLIEEALRGEREEAEEEQKAAEKRERLRTYEARLAKKKEKAEAIPEEMTRGAEKVLALAATILDRVRSRRAALGLPAHRPKGAKPCGVPLALHHGHDATVVGARICREEDCPIHGPVHQARRIAAIVRMPLVRTPPKGEAGTPVIGTPLGWRPLHEYRFSSVNLGSFRDSWGRAGFAANSAYSMIMNREDGRNLPQTSPGPLSVHGYVTFAGGNGEIIALTTAPLVIGTGKKGGRPSVLAGSYVGPVAEEDAEARILALGLESIRATEAEDLGGMKLDPRVIVGTITSSHTLHLDPERTVSVAQAAPWLAIGEVPLAKLRDGLRAAGIAATTQEDAYSPGEVGKVTAREVTPETLFDVVQAAGTSFGSRPATFTPAVFIDPTVDELDDDLMSASA